MTSTNANRNPFTLWNNESNNWTPNANPFTLWNVAPFNSNPFNATLTAMTNNTPSTPAVNTYENNESYVFELAAPGYTSESFEVAYYNSTLAIKATPSSKERNNNYSYREFNYTSFTREFSLPNNADANDARAKYDNGILTVIVPKTSNSNWRTIKIS